MISKYVELEHIQPLGFFRIWFQLFEVFSPRKLLWLRSVKVWCLPNDMKVPQATHLLFLCTHFSMSEYYCPWQQVLAIIPDSSMLLSVLQFRQRWHCQQWKIGQHRAPSPNWPSLAVIYSKQSDPSMLLVYTRTVKHSKVDRSSLRPSRS